MTLTTMIATVSPAASNYSESLSTLKYANRAKNIQNAARRNEDVSDKIIADVYLDDEEGVLRLGLRGRGKVHTAWIPLGTRLWRFLSHTFSFKI